MRRRPLPLIALTALCATLLLASTATAGAGGLPTFTSPTRADTNVEGHNEPATIIDRNGVRYVAYQRGSQLSKTTDGGRTWTRYENVLDNKISGCSTTPEDIGDVELATDQAGRTYFADLQATAGAEADNGVQPVVAHSDDSFRSYNGTCAAHQPFMVDREWMAAYTPPGKGADDSVVYITYHDFGPNSMWINKSTNGGLTWGTPFPIPSSADAITSSFCDTVPGAIAVDPRNGYVYVSWAAGDNPATNAGTGCNYTQATVFNKLFVSVSKDQGASWTTSLAFTGPDSTSDQASDLSEIFTSLGIARDGTVYVNFPAYRNGEFGSYLASASAPTDTNLNLSFGDPIKVSGSDVHTAYFTRLVVGDSGRVDVVYLGSPVTNVIATPANKTTFDGTDPTKPNCSPEVGDPGGKGVRDIGKPCEMPATAPWYLYLAQTTDGTHFANEKLRTDAVHTGDICTLGIFCLGDDNRDLADTNDIKIDKTGGAQIAYTAESTDGKHQEIDFQCQKGGPGLYAKVDVKSCR